MSENLTAICYLISAIFYFSIERTFSPRVSKKWKYTGDRGNVHSHCHNFI